MDSLIRKLHPLERAVLPVLKEETELLKIIDSTKLKEVEVIRALQWLENKKIITTKIEKFQIISLDKNGQRYKEKGLPEKIFLSVIDENFKGLNVITKKSKLSREEINACIGLLKSKKAIETEKGEFLQVKITDGGRKLLNYKTAEEEFLTKNFPLKIEEIKDIKILDELKKRKEFVKIEEQRNITVQLTELGVELLKEDLSQEVVNRLTAGMLKTGEWKNKQFRAYDVEINVPVKYPGKKHFVTQAVEYVKSIWLDLGFKEMQGNYVQSAFWDLDALFVPQDHPARDMQDTFYLPGTAKLPPIWKKVKAVHENGGDTNSLGWGGEYSPEEASRILLRTHTTVLSAKKLAELKPEDLPAKYFNVGLVFRNEALDWKHLFEFYQIDGIVIDPNANLKHLKGYLTQFYKKMGFEKVRMRPAHFPYTEPSLEVDVFHPIRKEWVELGGAGIFRPEVVKTLLGIDVPVLAWGQGIGRIILEYWKIEDIRQLYKNDLKQIREMKLWLK
ncbi:MAG TPA: phenylalanine--tRNA ligase subunit alpha [Candidatus Nanoarchaeia archaeon]|nr:phenylalanine--tRNA ligase subunit alpha [Candidatus Nanoarchaeia archaeon]